MPRSYFIIYACLLINKYIYIYIYIYIYRERERERERNKRKKVKGIHDVMTKNTSYESAVMTKLGSLL